MAKFDLRSSSLRSRDRGDDLDPMASLANLADVMLVFACGVMMALITYWQVDISAVSQILPDEKVAEIDNPEDITDQLKDRNGMAYLDMGRVYMDPTTGKYYMVVDNGSEQEQALEDTLANADMPEDSTGSQETAGAATGAAAGGDSAGEAGANAVDPAADE